MKQEILIGLALLNIHRDVKVNVNKGSKNRGNGALILFYNFLLNFDFFFSKYG
jgi:hypothetical protein